ncbi:uncharacterized protein LOC129601213 [Paramacrobiotus metropolitanus]|uniref:uncharacterized protein LOC129601213 n=1 Tax=Paramacrobiotus metropolitanus TaxID=2943436 RepID=UPI00244644B8|nr:uncharacterized protein LOC129601213 [Paramacrobiotus metropolitanus]
MPNATDSCGFPLVNFSIEHAALRRQRLCKQSMDERTAVTFLIFLSAGTLGNGAGVIFLLCRNFCRKAAQCLRIARPRRSKVRSQDIFLIIYLSIHFLYLWNRCLLLLASHRLAAAFPCLDEDHALVNNLMVLIFIDAFLILLSQGALAVYAVDRFVAVFAPARYMAMHGSTSRNFIFGAVCVGYAIFIAASTFSLLALHYGPEWGISSSTAANWSLAHSWIQSVHQLACAIIITVFCALTVWHLWKRFKRKPPSHRPSSRRRDAPQKTHRIQGVIISATVVLLASTVLYWIGNGADLVWSILYIVSRRPLCWCPLPVQYIMQQQTVTDLLRHLHSALSFGIYGGTLIRRWLCPSGESAYCILEMRTIAVIKK